MREPFFNAIEFLMYSYFKLDMQSNCDTIIERIIKKAYADATQQGAYNTLVPESCKEESDKAKSEGEEIIRKFLEKIDLPEMYSELHQKCCAALVRCYANIQYIDGNQKKLPAFSDGNAQKWVNMTTKYMYMLSYIYMECQPDHDFCEKYAGKFVALRNELQIPVDSFILEKVWNDLDMVSLPLRKGKCRSGKYSSDKIEPWSKWEKDTYYNFYDDLRKAVDMPIDWEGRAWIEIAKKRKGK